MNTLIVFDKDGTLTKTKSGKTFSATPDDQELIFDTSHLPGGTEYIFWVASNQKGIELGHKTREFLEEEFNYLDEITNRFFDGFIVCPDNGETVWIKPEHYKPFISFAADNRPKHATFEHSWLEIGNSLAGTFRKPHSGMLKLIESIASQGGEVEITKRVFIGDMDSDREAAMSAGWEYWDIKDWIAVNGLQNNLSTNV